MAGERIELLSQYIRQRLFYSAPEIGLSHLYSKGYQSKASISLTYATPKGAVAEIGRAICLEVGLDVSEMAYLDH